MNEDLIKKLRNNVGNQIILEQNEIDQIIMGLQVMDAHYDILDKMLKEQIRRFI